MFRIITVVIAACCFSGPAIAAGSTGGISPDGMHGGGIGSCVADRHGEFCQTLAYLNESEADLAGLFRANHTDDRGVSPIRGTIKLQKRVDGQWITVDRRSASSTSNACHTTQKLRIKLPIMQMTNEPHRLIAQLDGSVVARQSI